MSNWANYVITAVKYDGSRISSVKRRRVSPEGDLSEPIELPREAVAQDLEFDVSYCTAIQDPDTGEWEPGDAVEGYELDGELFIKTEQGDRKADNLEGLPEY
jgi:hypothetical protein